ncbi:MAG: hypothetical protein A2297_08865 [Elusimicrobia bacterium RIFOXYB2_FULL_48_7]|nr:MAG: hypothetical protein A2297_08865 [Elusimicrobia bacterium RIFOXYB2_FULL_48_7]
MENIPLLRDLIILLAASIPISIICRKLNIPAIVGFLITGVIIGPDSLALIHEKDSVNVLSEIGVIFLLFTIGLEISLERFARIKRFLVIGGGLQILLTNLAIILIAKSFGFTVRESVFFGFFISLSSTAIVLKSYMDKAEIHTPHAHIATGILLFQDFCVVPMLLLIPSLGTAEAFSFAKIFKTMLISGAAITLIIGATYFLIPIGLAQVVKFKDREIFTVFVILLCLGTAWLTNKVGLSLAIGGFIAGLILSKSDYSHQIVSEILPLKDIFISVFFISIGMLVKIHFMQEMLLPILLITLAVILIKFVFGSVTVLLLKYPLRIALITGIGLAQVGEFSFLLLKFGENYRIISPENYQYLLSIALLTMLFAPFLIRWTPSVLARFSPLKEIAPSEPEYDTEKLTCNLSDHVIIIGYGVNGKNLAKVLKETGIKYYILELNASIVSQAKKNGEPIFYGDATRTELLEKLGIRCSRVIVFAISDPSAVRRGVWAARKLNPGIYILVRTRYLVEIEELHKLGANQVIPEEFETSIEIFSRVLQRFHIPNNIIETEIKIIRKEGYKMLRGLSLEPYNLTEIQKALQLSLTETFLVDEKSPAAGKNMVELDLRNRTGVTIIAVVRDGKAYTNPQKDFVISNGDVLVLLGSHKQLNDAMKLLEEQNDQE